MDMREHPRIQLPFEVEVTHPSLGCVQCIARDISEGGMFVVLDSNGVSTGSKVKVTVIANLLTESTPTPTVSMEVVRLAEDGIGLKFTNKTSRHLWESVVRQRVELAIGRDYFQVYQGAAVVNAQGKVLVVQQRGKWLLPGCHLMVGQPWLDVLTEFLAAEVGIDQADFRETLAVDSGVDVVAAEHAMISLFHRFHTDSVHTTPRRGSRYSKVRWVGRVRGVDELSFSHPLLRDVAGRAIERDEAESGDESSDRRLRGRV
jgi:hypothetical protein